MNSLMFCLALLISTNKDTGCREKFYDFVLKDNSAYIITFVKFNIADGTGSKPVLGIQGNVGSLYSFFQKTKGMSFDAYQKYMKDVLYGRQVIDRSSIGGPGIYLEIPEDKYVENVAKKGKKELINHFFVGGVFRYDKFPNQFNPVAAKLFDYGVFIGVVENGNYGIIYDANCF